MTYKNAKNTPYKCTKCGGASFYIIKQKRYGYFRYCKPCTRKTARKWRANPENRKKELHSTKLWRENNSEMINSSNRKWRSKNKKKTIEYKKKYISKYADKVRKSRQIWIEANKIEIAKFQKSYREKNRKKIGAQVVRWKKKNKVRVKESNRYSFIKTTYGLSKSDYLAMLEQQESKCAICRIETHTNKNPLCVDHCHSTEKIRGLLCKKCNWAIGLLKDNPEIMLNAASYVARGRVL